jgi:alpha-beta hydrolase superfamily lysophospholipase
MMQLPINWIAQRFRRALAIAVLAVAAVACAPLSQQALRPVAPVAPAFEGDRFVSFDGAQLGLSSWRPTVDQEPWAAIVALHGMGDYAAAFALVGPWFAERGVAVYAYDQRGHGRSPQRGVWGGETLLTEDLRTAVRLTRAEHPNAMLAVLGESMGAAVAMTAFGGDNPPLADRLILCAPAVWGWSSLPRTYALGLWVGAHTMPGRAVTAPRRVQRRITPTDNREALVAMGLDRLMVFETRIDAVYGLVSLMERASESGPRLSVPVAFLYGARDDIIPGPAAVRAAAGLPATARTALYAEGYHLLLRDRQRAIVAADILAFLRDAEGAFPSGAPPLPVRWPPRND